MIRCSISFDIFRFVLIFLTYFGHNLGTVLQPLIARETSHIPDKGQVTVRRYGLYANAYRGKVRKAGLEAFPLRIFEEELRRFPHLTFTFAAEKPPPNQPE